MDLSKVLKWKALKKSDLKNKCGYDIIYPVEGAKA